MKQQIKEQIYSLRERNIEQIAHFISESDIHSDDFDLIVQQIPILIYLIQGDNAFDWCYNMLIQTNDSDFKKYAWIIEEIGYRSDGFSLDFIQKVFSIIQDTTIPARIRGALAVGSIRHDVFFRENKVYDIMYDICQYCMSPNLDQEFVLWFSSKNNPYYILPKLPNINSSFDRIKLFSGFQKPLIKRKRAIEQYKNNKLLIQDSLLENIVSGRTKGSKCCLEIGFNSENLEIIRSLFLTLWGSAFKVSLFFFYLLFGRWLHDLLLGRIF
jgi:hypothetical protein